MHRIYFILIAVILGIGSLFLFWSPEPAKRKQRRALEKPMVASMEVPKEKPRVKEPAEDVEALPRPGPAVQAEQGARAVLRERSRRWHRGDGGGH